MFTHLKKALCLAGCFAWLQNADAATIDVAAGSDLQQAIDLGVSHISWYQLTIEPNTVFYRNTPVLPDDEILVDIFEQGAQLLQANGFVQYEVSAWSRQADFQPSQHNLCLVQVQSSLD